MILVWIPTLPVSKPNNCIEYDFPLTLQDILLSDLSHCAEKYEESGSLYYSLPVTAKTSEIVTAYGFDFTRTISSSHSIVIRYF